MSEQLAGHTTGEQPTGHAVVDQVLASLTVLDDLPVAEHVAVFEQAHAGLRAALDVTEPPTDAEPDA